MNNTMEMGRLAFEIYRGIPFDAVGKLALNGGFEAGYKLLDPTNLAAAAEWIRLDTRFDSPEAAKIAAQAAARAAIDSLLDSSQP